MDSAYFPPGTEIGNFVIELFLKQTLWGHSYIASDQRGRKYVLSVLSKPIDPAAEYDIEIWTESQNPGISPDIFYYNDPVPMIAEPYIPGLTLEEEQLAGFTLQPREAARILRQVAEIREDLLARGGSDNSISLESILLKPDKTVIIQRDNLFYSDFDTVYSKLADACFALVQGPVPAAELKRRFFENPNDDFTEETSEVFPQHPSPAAVFPHASKGKKWIMTGLFVLLAALFVIPGVLILRKRKASAAEVVVQTMPAAYHTKGPVVHSQGTVQKIPQVQKKEIAAVPRETVKKAPPKKIVKAPPKKTVKAPPKKTAKRIVHRSKTAKKVRIKRTSRPPVKKVQPLVAQAAKRGSLSELRNLISSGADVNLKDAAGKSAMHYAAAADWTAMIDLLHKAGAKITPADINAARKYATRRYMQRLLNPPPRPPRAINAARNQISTPRNVVPRTNGWKKGLRNWNITLEHAVIKARPARKKILVLFTGADWCGPCKMLEKTVLSSSDFRRLARKTELVYINFPRREKMPAAQRAYNEKLRRDLRGGGGVPNLLILDHNGKRLMNIGGYRPKDRYIATLKSLLR